MMREASHSTAAIFPAYWLIPVSCLAPIPPFVSDNLFSHHSPGTSSQQDFSFVMQYNCQADFCYPGRQNIAKKQFSNLFICEVPAQLGTNLEKIAPSVYVSMP